MTGSTTLHQAGGIAVLLSCAIGASAHDAGPDVSTSVPACEAGMQPVFSVPPTYPESMSLHPDDGRVLVVFTVLRDGTVDNVRVIAASDNAFREPAERAVQRWRYDGRTANCENTVQVSFIIEPESTHSMHYLELVGQLPAKAYENCIRDGWVVVELSVTEHERLQAVVAVDAYPPNYFDQAAIAAVTKAWPDQFGPDLRRAGVHRIHIDYGWEPPVTSGTTRQCSEDNNGN